jgi:hypothetical protein
MHSAAVAEWILSLVATPDRAASTVGDLVEEGSSRGILWFWSSVLRTAGSHLWHDLTVSPLQMLGLALWGVGANYLFTELLGLPISMVRMRINEPVRPWEIPLLMVLVCTAPPLLAGWKVARRSAGRELPTAFAVAALFAAIDLAILCLMAMQVRPPGMGDQFTVSCGQALSVIAGAILFRRRHKSPIAQVKDAVAAAGDRRIVSHQDHRHAEPALEFVEQLEDLGAGLGVEAAGGLIRQQDGRIES